MTKGLREGNKKANIRLVIILILLTVGALTFIRSDAFADFINRIFT